MEQNAPQYPAEQAPQPFWELMMRDFKRTLDQALILAILVCLLSLFGVARDWLRIQLGAAADTVAITLVYPAEADQELVETVAAELAEREEVFAVVPFGPDDARERLEATGVDLGTIDPFALQAQPSGLEFHWRGLAHDLGGFAALARALQDEHGVEIHWPRDELRDNQRADEELIALFDRLRRWGMIFLSLAIVVIAISLGRPRVGRTLGRGELIQVLVARALIGSMLGWFVAGAVLHLTVGKLDGVTWVATWRSLIWVVPVATLLAPLGAVRLEREDEL